MYTEWYRNRGYNFDITSTTSRDQAYQPGHVIYKSVSDIVDQVYDQYVRRAGHQEPFFTQFCNGTTSKCDGLSQWGTVPLAQSGMSALNILKTYYPKDIEITTAPVGTIVGSYPGYALRRGYSGDAVRQLQTQLNRIRANYPAIPQITNPTGTFDAETEAAVKKFQSVFGLTADGVVGESTWNKVNSVYTGVTGLGELTGEGERVDIGAEPPTTTVQQGSRGAAVVELQFILNKLHEAYPQIAAVVQDGTFGASTAGSVREFQRMMGMTADGVVV